MRKIIFTCCLLFLLLTVLEIGITYGLFETNKLITVDNNIAKWQIKVNNSVINNLYQNFNVTNFVVEEDANVASGKFAPNSKGYFDIVIDPNETGVAFRYDVAFDWSKLSNTQISILDIEAIGGDALILSNKDTYSGIILLDEIQDGVTRTIRVNLEWNNDENNNLTDSEYGLNISKEILIPVSIKFSQYLGEPIEVYTGSGYTE